MLNSIVFAIRRVAPCIALLAVGSFCAPAALGQCPTLGGTVSNWIVAGSGNWNTGGNWSAGEPNSATTSACITNDTSGTPTVVTLNVAATVDDLQLGSFDALSANLNTQLTVASTQIINAGSIVLNGGGGYDTMLQIDSSNV